MSNFEYWVKREEENRKQNLKDIKDYDKEVERIYKRMLNEVDTQINAWYSKYAAEEDITMAEAKKRADRLDIEAYAEKAKKYVEEKDFSPQANAEMKLYNLTMKANRLQLLKANIGIELVSGGDELEKYYQEVLEGKSIAEIERLSGILGKTIVDNNKLAKSIVGASFHNATWSERIWMHQDLLKSDLDKILATSIIQGKNPRVFIPEVRQKFGVTANNAERLLRTEIRRVQTDTQMESYKRNGFDSYTFVSLGTACGDCLKNNGLHFRINEMGIGLNAPPIHPNCLCATAPYLDTSIFDEWLEHIDEGMTFEEYKSAHTTDRALAVRNGNIYGIKTQYSNSQIPKTVSITIDQSLHRVFKKHPSMKEYIQNIEFTSNLGNKIAAANIDKNFKTTLKLNVQVFQSEKSLNELLSKQFEDLTFKSGIDDYFEHELTHFREWKTAETKAQSKKEAWELISQDSLSREIVKKACTDCKLEYSDLTLKREVGVYGATRPSETIAEAMSGGTGKLCERIKYYVNKEWEN